MKPKFIVVHYGEIGLKGKNRGFFEKKLVQNIKTALKEAVPASKILRLSGRILIDLKDNNHLDGALEKLKDVFGISSFYPVFVVKTEMEEIKKGAENLLNFLKDKDLWQNNFAKGLKEKTFKVETQRSFKQFPMNSMEISRAVGGYLAKTFSLSVNLQNPDIIINIELAQDKTFVGGRKIRGSGGLPVGVSGKVLVLLSGGIDSPVAAYLVMKRGCRADFIHFHSYPYTDKASIEKVEELIEVLKKYEERGRLFVVPIIDFQKEVLKNSEQKYRIILYRRMMYQAAQNLAIKYGYLALVSGDSLGQVASQTIENISVISHQIKIPILRPLISFDKEEIIVLAKKIGTFDISILPHDDCCGLFMPKAPATKANLEKILEEEKKLRLASWAEKVLKETEARNL